MHNVAPTRALARRTRQLLTLAFAIAAVGVFVAVVGLALFVVQLAPPGSRNYAVFALARVAILIIGIIIFLVALGFAVRALTIRTDNDLALVTGRFLARYLDTRYHFIRNLSRREIGYVDAVLVGPPGLLVFRIVDNRGVFANEGANWMKQDARGRWSIAGIDLTRECVQDVKRLREYLAKHRLADVPVFGVIVFTKEEPLVHIAAKDPVVPVTTLGSALVNLGSNYFATDRIDANQVRAVVRLLYET
jgi:hypothetical protein